MSDYDLPSQFVDQAQDGEDYDDLLGVEFFGNDDFIADLDGEQGLDILDESTSQQDIAPSATPGVPEQQPEIPSNIDVRPPLDLDWAEFLEDGDFVQESRDSTIDNATLAEAPSQAGLPELGDQPQSEQRDGSSLVTADQLAQSQLDLTAPQSIDSANGPANVNRSQVGLMSGDDQAQPPPAELGAAGPSSTGLPTLEQIPDFDFDVFDSQQWRDLGNTGADFDIDDILGDVAQVEQQQPDHAQGMHVYRQEHGSQAVGTSSNHNESFTASRQRLPADTTGADAGYSTAARSRGVTHSLPPAIPHQANNTVVPPGPVNRQEASRAKTAAVRPPPAEYHADIDDQNSNRSDDESESSSVPDEPEYEEYEQNDRLIIPDPPQDKWGQTGKRNGQEVWFNPESQKWRKFLSFHLTKVVSPNGMQNHRHLIMI